MANQTFNCFFFRLLQYRKVVLLLVISVLSFTAGFNVGGPHQFVFQSVYKQLIRCLYWIGLGKFIKFLTIQKFCKLFLFRYFIVGWSWNWFTHVCTIFRTTYSESYIGCLRMWFSKLSFAPLSG